MKRPTQPLAALIIAGGRGTRFWPEARSHRPKPLFRFDGERSLLEDTIARVQPRIPSERIFVLVAADQARAFKRALKGLLPAANLIVEPEGRGTAVAIAYGTAIIGHRVGPEVIVAIMPADHFVPEAEAFSRTIGEASELARREHAIVVIGVTPTRPETGYGYQQIGRAIGAGFQVARFVEKPDAARARRMVRSGRYLWNAGIFVMSLTTLRRELDQHAPALAAMMDRFGAMKPAELGRVYHRLVFDSFDRVVAEKSRRLLGVRARFTWNDVGSWEGLWAAMRGESHSVVTGQVVALHSSGVLARGGKRLMVLLGVEDLVAIDTEDALLIAHKSRSQEVGQVLDELKRRGLHSFL
ncbi:MAG TPA: mannose-1-phosphate guanylyltransferase [Candidatus Binataceae bacterium]|nr:mannose-1-phosphate guanylyltransferase [Candidatus Binataceae bacterium]